MFKNIGEKIQLVSSTIFVLQCMIGLLFGAALGAFIADIMENPGLGIAVGILVIVICIFFAWLSQLLLYAYGKIAECSEEQCRLLRQLIALQGGEAEAKEVSGGQRICVCGEQLDADAAFCPVCGRPCRNPNT